MSAIEKPQKISKEQKKAVLEGFGMVEYKILMNLPIHLAQVWYKRHCKKQSPSLFTLNLIQKGRLKPTRQMKALLSQSSAKVLQEENDFQCALEQIGNHEALRFFSESMLQKYQEHFCETKSLKAPDEFLEYLFKIRFFEPDRACLDFLIQRRDERLGRNLRHLYDESFLKRMAKKGYGAGEVKTAIEKFVALLKKQISKDEAREYFSYFDREFLRREYVV